MSAGLDEGERAEGRLTARVTTAEQPRRVHFLLLFLAFLLLFCFCPRALPHCAQSQFALITPHPNPRLRKHPLLQDPVPRDLGHDRRGADDGEEGVRLRSDGEADQGEEARELGLVVGGGADGVDVALCGGGISRRKGAAYWVRRGCKRTSLMLYPRSQTSRIKLMVQS